MTNTSAEEAIRRIWARWFHAMESTDIDGLLSLLDDRRGLGVGPGP